MVFELLGNTAQDWIVLVIAAFGGGAFGAALGALPALIFAGFTIIAGETANVLQSKLVAAGIIDSSAAVNITGLVGLGPVFGPHVAFAGGVAAAAYAARQGYMDTGYDFFEAKNIGYALGTRPDVLAVGGAFGILGMFVRQVSGSLVLPWDPVAFAVVISAVVHRLAFGYPLIGSVSGDGILDMTPFERETTRQTAEGGEAIADGGVAQRRLAVEPWLPHMYRWPGVMMIGLAAGSIGAYIALVTGSFFLAFGISVATLVFLACGVDQIPVTHHVTLPASTAALVVAGSASGVPVDAVLFGTAFGILGAVVGELFQRIFYAHGDTHFDPPAASIVVTTLVIGILVAVGVFPSSGWIPLPM